MTLVAKRWLAVLSLGLTAPALAQNATPASPATQDIVVNAVDQTKSDWKRAETDHVIVFSSGSEGELRRVARNLELLHHLMSRLYRQGDASDDALKIRVTLLDSASRFRAIGLRDLRSQEGPYSPGFSAQRYYDPQEGGEILAVARVDLTVDLNTIRRAKQDCEDYQADDGAEACGTNTPNQPPVIRPWETILYGAFAQHFMLTYKPAAYPRWYLDGIGALFSSIDVQRSGAIDYARGPLNTKDVFLSYGYPDVGAILTGQYLDPAQDAAAQTKIGWSPYGAWLVAHYFLFSNLKPERRDQFRRYMAAIAQGTPIAEAAAVFGDMRKLQREILTHAHVDTAFAHADAPKIDPDPLIAKLSAGSGALIEARVGLESRLATTGADGTGGPRGTDWLTQLRGHVAQAPYDPDALVLEAEAECRSGHGADCLATAEHVLARTPDNAGALTWKGVALTDQAVAGPAADRPAHLTEARTAIERAIAIDNQAPAALIAYFQSFAKAGEAVPDNAMRAIATAIRIVPAAPGPRLYLAQEMVRRGQTDLARRLLQPVIHGAYDTPEKAAAERLFAKPASGVIAAP